MAKILSRSAWTTTSPKGPAFNFARLLGIVCHYPAAGKSIGVISQAAEASRLRGWRNYHVNGRGWSDIGYNYAIGQSGRIYSARGDRVGAHATGHNSTTIGVLFIVGDNEPLTPAAKRAFRDLRAHLRRKRDVASVWGHTQMAGASTRCPGPYIMGAIRNGELTGKGALTVDHKPAPAPKPKEWYVGMSQIREFYGQEQNLKPRSNDNILRARKGGAQMIVTGPTDFTHVTATINANHLKSGSVDIHIAEIVNDRITRKLATEQFPGGRGSVSAAWELADSKGSLAVVADVYSDEWFKINWVEISGVKKP